MQLTEINLECLLYGRGVGGVWTSTESSLETIQDGTFCGLEWSLEGGSESNFKFGVSGKSSTMSNTKNFPAFDCCFSYLSAVGQVYFIGLETLVGLALLWRINFGWNEMCKT